MPSVDLLANLGVVQHMVQHKGDLGLKRGRAVEGERAGYGSAHRRRFDELGGGLPEGDERKTKGRVGTLHPALVGFVIG